MPGTNQNRNIPALRPHHVRTAALAATIVGMAILPIAAAQASPLHGTKQHSVSGTPATGTPATAAALLPQFCGASQTGFQGTVSAQPCVNDQSGSVTGEVYVANKSVKPLTVVINLTRADALVAQMSCTIAAGDANGICETGALQASAGKGSFNAIAEMVPVNAPLALGVLHVESGQVAPSVGAGAQPEANTPSTAASPSTSPAA